MNNGLQLIGMDVGIKTDQYLAPPLVQCGASVVTYRDELQGKLDIRNKIRYTGTASTKRKVYIGVLKD
jgi:hypothetical protein